MTVPTIHVGVLSARIITFDALTPFVDGEGREHQPASYTVIIDGDNLLMTHENEVVCKCLCINLFVKDEDAGRFKLHNVVIGVGFHWERFEDQLFVGELKFVRDGDNVVAINVVSVEEYLKSVISSEMSATSSIELLKAHAVISRSWLLAQIEKSKSIDQSTKAYQTWFESDTERVKWYDREDHSLFDVCADDHCQRYQGITKASTLAVETAVNDTRGQLLLYEGKICDARFSKCCGGMTELFENAWEPVPHPYLQKLVDNDTAPSGFALDLTQEANANAWILGNPQAFCNTHHKAVLRQVLNDFDRETNDFYRWTVEYSQAELSELVCDRTGIDFGTITDLVPIERGVSGRLIRLEIIGTTRTLIIGKELEIRKALSKSHLYSSAFVVDKLIENGHVRFVLHGAGWGHGVGLCQIGAAVMGDKGYDYRQILSHYFVGAHIEKRY